MYGFELLAVRALLHESPAEFAKALGVSEADLAGLDEAEALSPDVIGNVGSRLADACGTEHLYSAIRNLFEPIGFTQDPDSCEDFAPAMFEGTGFGVVICADGINMADNDDGIQLPGVYPLEDFPRLVADLPTAIAGSDGTTEGLCAAWSAYHQGRIND